MTLRNIKDFSKIRDSRLRQFYCPYFFPKQMKIPLTWKEEPEIIDYCSKNNKKCTLNMCSHCLTYPHIKKFRNTDLSIDKARKILREMKIIEL